MLGELAAHTGSDPCNPALGGWGYGHGSSRDERAIRALNAKCETKFSSAELAAIVRSVSALSSDKDSDVRAEVAKTLGRIASSSSVPTLTALSSDAFKLEGSTICTTTGNGPERCRPNWPVREAAREALERIADVRKRERKPAGSSP